MSCHSLPDLQVIYQTKKRQISFLLCRYRRLTNNETISFTLSTLMYNFTTGSVTWHPPNTRPSVRLTTRICPVSKPIKAFWLLSSVCHHTQHVGKFGKLELLGKAVTSVKDHLQSIFCFLSTIWRAGTMYRELSKPTASIKQKLKMRTESWCKTTLKNKTVQILCSAFTWHWWWIRKKSMRSYFYWVHLNWKYSNTTKLWQCTHNQRLVDFLIF